MKCIRTLGVLSVALFTINCGKVRFTPTKPTIAGNTSDIVQVPCGQDSFRVPTKVLFIVDQSGSNHNAYEGHRDGTCGDNPKCVPATDRDKSFRSGSIAEFFTRYNNRKNLSWGVESFSGQKAQSLLWVNGVSRYFGDAEDMQAAIIRFKGQADEGFTPYLAALSLTYRAISTDPDFWNSKFAAKYYIIFMSDGYPTDSKMEDINRGVQSIVNLAPARISLSTVYYARQTDSNAQRVLQGMSVAGRGQFVKADVHEMKKISIKDLINLPTMSCR